MFVRKRWIGSGVLAAVVLLAACDSNAPEVPEPRRFEIIAPARVGDDGVLPMVIRRIDASDSLDTSFSGSVFVETAGGALSAEVTLRHGVAGHTAWLASPAAVDVQVVGEDARHAVAYVADYPRTSVSGTLGGAEITWTDSADVLIATSVEVPEGSRLIVGPGARILLGPGANLVVRGSLDVRGTQDAPVTFSSASAEAPWGGVVVEGGDLRARFAFFINGGGDESREFGHSDSQAVLMMRGAEADLQHVYLMDNPGKGIGASLSVVRFDRGLITRCDTGGEVHRSLTHLTNSHILEIPSADAVLVDDDNDGFYFYDAHPAHETPSTVERSFVIVGKDDAIDHNQARLEIRTSWLEGFLHECVAGSSGNSVRVFNSVVKGCQQGVEAGYGSPTVLVEHSVIVENEVGIRFGDSYTNPLEGQMSVINSIVDGNEDNFLNLDLQTGAPVDGAITVSHSITNDETFRDCSGCLVARPLFDAEYFLLPGSPGLAAGTEGADMGLLRSRWK